MKAKKTKKEKKAIKKTIKRKAKKPGKKRRVIQQINILKGRCNMAGKKRRKISRKRHVSRRRGVSLMAGKIGSTAGIAEVMIDGGLGVAGAIGGSLLSNMAPIADPRIKAALPLVAGIAIGMTNLSKKKQIAAMASGMIIIGGVSLVKQFFPNIPLLAGEEEYEEIPEEIEGENVSLLGQNTDLSDMLEGESVDMMGEEFLSPADI